MKKIGITGASGFIGYHLSRAISLNQDYYKLVPFKRDCFYDNDSMDEFVTNCDVIVHLAALNRHENDEVIFQTNLELTDKLIEALLRTDSRPHVIYTSSVLEKDSSSLYGSSKKESRIKLFNWSKDVGSTFTGLLLPNIFGPFSKPFYNTVVATFSHQLIFNHNPMVKEDRTLGLLYVGDLVNHILKNIDFNSINSEVQIQATEKIKVSDILLLLARFKKEYYSLGNIPNLCSKFELDLFNTFRSFIPLEETYPRLLEIHKDNRGSFTELIRANSGGQTSFSTTLPRVTRGEHFNTRKIERLMVIKGQAMVQMRKIGSEEIFSFILDGRTPSYVDIPIWYTHNISNIGDEELITVFWINEPYNIENPDTWMEPVISKH